MYKVDDSSQYTLISRPKQNVKLINGIVPQDVVLFRFQVVCSQLQNFDDMKKKNFVPNKILHYNIVNGIHKKVLGAADEDFNVEKIALDPNSIYNLLYHPKKILDEKIEKKDKKYAKNKKKGNLKGSQAKTPPKSIQKPEINKNNPPTPTPTPTPTPPPPPPPPTTTTTNYYYSKMSRQGKHNSSRGGRGGRGNHNNTSHFKNDSQVTNFRDDSAAMSYSRSNKTQKEISIRVPVTENKVEKQYIPMYNGTCDKESFLSTVNKFSILIE